MTHEKFGDVTVLTLRVEYLDAGNTKDLKRDLNALVEPKAKVVLDLGRVQFVDSSGCGTLLYYLRQLSAVGGDVKLCAVTRPVRALFEMIRMHKVFEICNTKDEAVRAYEV
jgi:anti-sigma B factor antagonist